MRLLNNFKCPRGHNEEYLVESEIPQCVCRICGETAFKQLSAPKIVKINGFSSFIDTQQWVKDRQTKLKREMDNNS